MIRLPNWYEAMLAAQPQRHYHHKTTTQKVVEAFRHARKLRRINRTVTLQ